MQNKKTIIFTDGSSLGNPGAGGWGAVVWASNGRVVELGGAEEKTTNNRMEMTAIIEALSLDRLDPGGLNPVIVWSDSSYVINGITKWVHGWQKNDWKKKDGSAVLNKDLWERLVGAAAARDISWRHVSGHIGTPGNERADKIATAFAAGDEPHLYAGAYADYGVDLEKEEDAALKTARGASKARAKAKAYSYVSLVDGVFQKHKTWAACEARVKGKQGARFRKALSAEDEKAILAEWGVA